MARRRRRRTQLIWSGLAVLALALSTVWWWEREPERVCLDSARLTKLIPPLSEAGVALRDATSREDRADVDRQMAPIFESRNDTGRKSRSAKGQQWQKYPRARFSFPQRVAFVPSILRAPRLVRHVELNPSDKELSLSQITTLISVLERGQQRISKLQALAGSIASKELRRLMKLGKARKRTMAEYVASLSPELRREHEANLAAAKARAVAQQRAAGESTDVHVTTCNPDRFWEGRIPIVQCGDGETSYGADLIDLPLVHGIHAEVIVENAKLAEQIVNVFVRAGALSTPSAQRLLDRALLLIERQYRKKMRR